MCANTNNHFQAANYLHCCVPFQSPSDNPFLSMTKVSFTKTTPADLARASRYCMASACAVYRDVQCVVTVHSIPAAGQRQATEVSKGPW